MQVSVEQLEGLERRVTVQVPAETVEKEIQNRLQSLSRKARLDGFRPGKVPLKIIKRMYGVQVRQEVVGETMERSFYDALQQENLLPIGSPRVEPVNVAEGEQLEYQATFEVLPEFSPKEIAGRTIRRPVAEVNDADVENMIEALRKQRAEWSEVERPARTGDRLTISFEGKLDGGDFPGNKAEETTVVLGQGQMLESFEQPLLEQMPGAERDFDVTFPESYPREQLAGKTVRFHVRIHRVAEPRLPEIDGDFIKSFGVEDGTVEGLRKALRENMERELAEGIKSRVKQQVMDALLAENDILVPQALIDQEIDSMARQAGFKGDDDNPDTKATKRRFFETEARRRVALGLIVSRLLKSYDLKLDEQRVQQRLTAIAASYEDSDEVIGWYRKNAQLMDGIHNLVLEDQLVERLLDGAQLEEQASSFDEIMRSGQGAETGGSDASDTNREQA